MVINILKSKIFLTAVIIAAAWMSYFYMLKGEFSIVDDRPFIVENVKYHDLSNIGQIFTSSFFGGNYYYRPITALSFMLEYHFIGTNKVFYNADNLIIHSINSVLVFLIILFFVDSPIVAFFVGLLFVIHPIHWEEICNVSGRSILLCALFYFFSFLMFLNYSKTKKKYFILFSILSFVLALLSKETAITLPLVIAIYLILIEKNKISKVFLELFPYVVAVFAYLTLRKFLGITNVVVWNSFAQLVLGISTFLKGTFIYFKLMIFPTSLHLDRSIVYFGSFFDPYFILTLVVYVLAMFGVLTFRKRIKPIVLFFILWFYLTISCVSQILPVQSDINRALLAEHFLYIPSLGGIVLMVLGFNKLFFNLIEKKQCARHTYYFAICSILLMFLFFSVKQSILSQRKSALFISSLEYEPSNTRIRNALALDLVERGLLDDAQRQYEIVLNYHPTNLAAKMGIAKIYHLKGLYWQAIEMYESTFVKGGYEKILKEHLGYSYSALIEKLKERAIADPNNDKLYYSIGVLLFRDGDYNKAKYYFQKAVELNPNNQNAVYNLNGMTNSLEQ